MVMVSRAMCIEGWWMVCLAWVLRGWSPRCRFEGRASCEHSTGRALSGPLGGCGWECALVMGLCREDSS